MRRLLLQAGLFALYLALAAVATRPLAADLVTQTFDKADALKDAWEVHWLATHLTRPSELFTGNTFHPTGVGILASDMILGTVVLTAPLLPLAGDPIAFYNVSVLVGLAFAGWAFQVLAYELTGRRAAAAMAGVLAAFGSHQLFHVYHLNLLSVGWLALFLLGLHRLLRRPGPGPAVLTGVSAALSAQTSGYYGVAALVVAVVFAAAHARALANRRAAAALAGAAAVSLVLAAPYLHAYLEARQKYNFRRGPIVSESLAFDPARDLTSRGYVYRWAIGSGGERLFPGLLSLGLGAVAIARRRPGFGFYTAAALAFLVLGLGPVARFGTLAVPLPYAFLRAVPPFDGMRHPCTFAGVATMMLAVLAGRGAARHRVAAGRRAGILALAAVVETVGPPTRVQAVPLGVPPAYTILQTLPPGPILDMPVLCFDCMVWAARHGLPVLNGQRTAFVPPELLRLDLVVRNHWMDRPVEDLAESKATGWLLDRFPVRYVIVPAGRRPELRQLVDAFDRCPLFRRVAQAADGDRVYEVVAASPGPAP